MQNTSQTEKLKNSLTAIRQDQAEYPQEWQSLPDAPKILYALGDISLLKSRKFTIVGSRAIAPHALKLGEKLSQELSHAFTIVTGTAEGGDSAAIEGALSGSGKIVCLLAGGFSAMPQNNLDLMRKVAKCGLLLSPHPFETPVRSFSYAYRNKLLAALGEGALVISAGEKSGALITANYALQAQKPVFAFPYPPNQANGAGCNDLIKRGAYLTENTQDISNRLPFSLPEKTAQVALCETEEKIYAVLREKGELHLTEISNLCEIPVFKLRAHLSSLEVKGLAVSLGGNRYAPV